MKGEKISHLLLLDNKLLIVNTHLLTSFPFIFAVCVLLEDKAKFNFMENFDKNAFEKMGLIDCCPENVFVPLEEEEKFQVK